MKLKVDTITIWGVSHHSLCFRCPVLGWGKKWTARLPCKKCCLRAGLICLNMSSSSAVSVFFVVGMFKWWYDLSDATKAAVIGGPLLVICILVIYCCCCRSRPANQGAVLVTPAVGHTAVMATSTNTTAPMRPLVNVAWVSAMDKCAGHAQFLINFEVFAEEIRLRVYAVWYFQISDTFRREIGINIINKLLHLRMGTCCFYLRRACKPALRRIFTVA